METVAAVSVAEQAAKNPLLFQKNLVALARKSMSLHNYYLSMLHTHLPEIHTVCCDDITC